MANSNNFFYAEATAVPSTSQYVANMMVGGVFSFDLTGKKWISNGGYIMNIAVQDNDLEGAAGEIHLFRGAIGPYADRTDFNVNITYADIKKRFLKLTLGTFESYTLCKKFEEQRVNIGFEIGPTDTTLSAIYKCTSTPTYAGSKEISIILGILK